jgi:serine/threonine protein kinase
MAPELVHKKQVGPQADLYAMGLILAEMITGKKLVNIENVYDTILFQASDKPIKLPEPIQSSPFAKIVKRAVEKDPARRYPTAAAMIADLRALQVPGGEPDPLAHLRPAPREFGSAAQETSTVPRSMGMPSIEEVERLVGQNRSAAQAAAVRTRPAHVPNLDEDETHAVGQVALDRLRQQHAHAHSPHPQDSLQFIPDKHAPLNHRPTTQTDLIPLDMERPGGRPQRRSSSSSGLSEIGMGFGLGLGILLVVIAILYTLNG